MARSNKNHDASREALINIALDLFLENGYENTTVSQIMKAANLSKGGMYHYFSSKEEILDAVIEFALKQELEKHRTNLKSLPLEERLIGFSRSVDISDFTRKLLSYSNNHADSIVSYKVREYGVHLFIPLLTEIFEEGIAAGLYNFPYPKEMAEFCVLLVKAISEPNILPSAGHAERLRRMEAFFYILTTSLGAAPDYMEKLRQIFTGDIEKINSSEDN
jgi:AcrR family transcriptional regulator